MVMFNKNVEIKEKNFFFLCSAPSMIPAWLMVVFIALAEIVCGAILFFVLRRIVLTKSEETTLASTYQAAPLEDISNN